MNLTSSIIVKKTKTEFRVYYKGRPFIRVTREVMSRLLSDFKILKSKKSTIKIADALATVSEALKYQANDSINKKAKTLIKLYSKEKSLHYNGRKIPPITEGHKDFKHFLKAASIIVNQDVSCKKFLSSQIEGLKFINNGNGRFPEPCNLSTYTAESRLLQYLKNEEDKDKPIALTKKDMNTPLTKNDKYVELYRKMKNGDATWNEVMYVADCQKVRKGSVTLETKALMEVYRE